MASCAVAFPAAVLAIVASASAVDVQGTLQVPSSSGSAPARANAESSDSYWEEWNGFLDPRQSSVDVAREFAVVLVGSGSSAPDSSFLLHGGNFAPSTMVARAGTTLRIENRDGCAHELYSDLAGFPAMQTAPGNARTLRLTKAGHWVVRDRLYRHVQGHLHVLPNLVARAQLNGEGQFRFLGVAPGSYTLKVFRGANEVASRAITIADGRELTLDPIALSAQRGTR